MNKIIAALAALALAGVACAATVKTVDTNDQRPKIEETQNKDVRHLFPVRVQK